MPSINQEKILIMATDFFKHSELFVPLRSCVPQGRR